MEFRRWVYDDGGRAATGFKISRDKGACACRAIAIATGKPYREVHDGLNALCALFGEPLNLLRFVHGRGLRLRRQTSSAETGIFPPIARIYLGQLGWRWTLTNMARLHRWDLPPGRLVVQVNQHYVALIDNVVHDHGEHWRGRRQVFGYFALAE